jgi:hypothetical protein
LVIVTPPAFTLVLGDAFPLQAEAQDVSGQLIPTATFFWSSSDTTIVTVSDLGIVHAKAAGTAEIAANTEGKFAIATVTVASVLAPVESVVVTPGTSTIARRGNVDLAARLYDKDGQELLGRPITWSASDTSIATVSSTGAFTASVHAKNKTGKTTITATSEGKMGTMQVTVSLLGL